MAVGAAGAVREGRSRAPHMGQALHLVTVLTPDPALGQRRAASTGLITNDEPSHTMGEISPDVL